MQNRYKRWLFELLKAGITIFALYIVFSKVDWHPVIHHLLTANLWLLLLSFILQNVSTICSSMRSQYYLSCYGLKLSHKQALCLYYIGMMFNVVLPGGIGGDGYRMLMMHRKHKFPKLQALRVMLYERVSGFYILVSLGLCFFPYTNFYELDPALRNMALFCLVAITPCYLWGVKYVLRDNITTALRAAIFSLGVQLLQVAYVTAVIYAIDGNVDYMTLKNYIFLFIVGSVVSIIPLSIGSIGLREVTFLYGLSIIGYTNTTYGVAIAMFVTVISIASGILGLIPWFFYGNSLKNKEAA